MVPAPGMSGRSSAVTQPGGRSLTAGTALRARSPVARQPAVDASRPVPSVNLNAVSWVIDGVPSISTRYTSSCVPRGQSGAASGPTRFTCSSWMRVSPL
jgi:hypothetical protein